MALSISSLPEMLFGVGVFDHAGTRASALSKRGRVLVIADAFLIDSGTAATLVDQLRKAQVEPFLFDGISGEPTADVTRNAIAAAKDNGVDVLIGIGGGSALDIAKLAACTAKGEFDPLHYGLGMNAMPDDVLATILIPTTAGTGSEANGTAIVSGAGGKKIWFHDKRAKTQLALLDPALTYSLPPHLTAWCGMDAFVHAFESATTRGSNETVQVFAHKALHLITRSLERAVADGSDRQAREDMLLGSFYAGYAIENAGTGLAHNISHALAGLGAVHHGLATSLAFERTVGWLVSCRNRDMERAAQACALADADELPDFVAGLMDRIGISRSLPATFQAVTADCLAREMRLAENRPMLAATPRPVDDLDIADFAESVIALAG